MTICRSTRSNTPQDLNLYTIMVQKNWHKCILISSYIQWVPEYFGQLCGLLQEYKIGRQDTLILWNEIMNLLEPIQSFDWSNCESNAVTWLDWSDYFIIPFYNFNIPCICFLYPWRWSHGLPKHVTVHCVYKLTLMCIYGYQYCT